MGFNRDFSLGKKGEKIVQQIFKKNNLEIEFNNDKTKLGDYDAFGKIGTKKFSIEIKYDWLSQKTNNLAIEYYNSSKDEKSGIDGTKANLWCHIILDQGNPTAWMASVKKLREFIKKNKPWKVIEKAGDGNSSLYLYNDIIILGAVFHRIDLLDEVQFKKLIKELLNAKV
jgi:hypothetical protein